MQPQTSAKPRLEIDLSKICENYLTAKKLTSSDTITSAVIKANAYGVGAKEAFKALSGVGCNDFYVIYLEEAMELHGLTHGNENIYIIGSQTDKNLHDVIHHGFIPVLNTEHEIKQYAKLASDSPLPCVIHFDTGMNRLGLRVEDMDRINTHGLDVKYIMSHLACADEPEHPMNKKQLQDMLVLKKKFNTKISFANSSGIFLGTDYHFDQTRPGCMLYGVNPTPGKPSPVKQVATVMAKVMRISTLTKDEAVSYGATYTAKAGTRIATLGIGYADGYHRSLSSNAFCYFKGHRMPIIGRVTMDFIMVDVSALSESELQEFDYAEVLGNNITVDETADRAKTIGYEILTSLQHRFNRVYK